MDNPKNPDDDCSYEVATGRELMEKYGLIAENRPEIKLNPENVPVAFRPFIPLAEEWGISDDLIRADVIAKASTEDLQRMIDILKEADFDRLFEWLAGPEAYQDHFTDEYIAFSCLILAHDEAMFEIEERAQEPFVKQDLPPSLVKKQDDKPAKPLDWRDYYL